MPEPGSFVRDLPARSATARTVLLLATMASIVLTGVIYVHTAVAVHAGHKFEPSDMFVESIIGAGAIALTALVTVAVVAAMRRRAERHGGVVAIGAREPGGAVDLLVARVDEIAAKLGVEGRFLLRMMPLDPRVAAHVRWGRDRRPLVVLSGGLLRVRGAEPAMVDGILAHELAHIRNRDVVPTTIAIAAWRATLILGVLPTAWILTVETQGWHLRVSALVVVGVVYLMRLGLLRSREFWADVRAGETEFRLGLCEVLTREARGLRSWPLLHPARKARIATLSRDNLSTRVLSLGEAFLAGTTIGIVLPAHGDFWRDLLPPLIGDLPAAFASNFLPLLPVIPFLLVTARAAGSVRARWPVAQGAITLLVLAAGVNASNWLDFSFRYSNSLANSIPWLNVVPSRPLGWWTLLLGIGSFIVISTLAIVWCRTVIALWARPGRRARLARTVVDVGVVLYGVLLFVSLQLVAYLLLETSDGWSLGHDITVQGVEAAARAPWDVVPGWVREINAGGFTGLFSYSYAMTLGPVAIVVPLLVALIRYRRVVRTLVLFLGGAVAVGVVNVALMIGIVADIDTLDAPARAQLPQNVYDIHLSVELLAGLLVAAGIGLWRRHVPVVVAACAGAALAAASFVVTSASRPVECLLTPLAAGMCEPGRAPQTLAEIVLLKMTPTLLCCLVAAVAGRSLFYSTSRRWTRPTGLPSPIDGSESSGKPPRPVDTSSPDLSLL